MRFYLIAIGLITGFGCSNKSNENPNQKLNLKPLADAIQLMELPYIGEYIVDSIRTASNNKMLLINSSDYKPSTTIISNGTSFNLAWDNNNKLIYISTLDTNFTTNEGIKIGSTLIQIKNLQPVEIDKIIGWGHSIKLSSGWSAAFCVDSTCTGRNLIDTDKVNWIFKNN